MGFFDSLKNFFAPKKKKVDPKKPVKVKLEIIDVERRFELLSRTGQGSMSKVWRARDKSTGRNVCVKLLDREKTAKFEARFQGLNRPSEGVICSSLRHENIVKTLEFGISLNKEPVLIMELIEGMGLNFLIETKSPKLDGNRVNFLMQFTEGLEYVHRMGYLHRDICPRNVMVTNEDVVKIIDFGLAIPYKPEFCKPGNRTGTPNYLAPEVIKRQSTDHRVDLFALGVTAYEIFTGTLPWEQAASMQTLLAHINTPGRDPRELRADLPDEIVKFLVKAIERDRDRRFQNAAAFKAALEELPADW